MARREWSSIVGDILTEVARADATERRAATITRLRSRANLPHDRLRSYLDALASSGLVTRDAHPRLTPKGREALRCYREWTRTLADAGLAELPEPPPPPVAAPPDS